MMRKALCLILTAVMLITLLPCAWADVSGTCGDNLTWALDSQGTLTLSGTGAMENFPYTDAPWMTYRGDIRSVVLSEGITSVGSYAFEFCRNLASVSLPQSLTKIGMNAFYATKLASVEIPAGVSSLDISAFGECVELTTIRVAAGNNNFSAQDGALFSKDGTKLLLCPVGKLGSYIVPQTVTSIETGAFAGSLLEEVIIPANVTTIKDFAFTDCSRMAAITVAAGNPNYSSDHGVLYSEDQTKLIVCPAGFQGSLILPGGVETIGQRAFYGCAGLTGINLPQGLTAIGSLAFAHCSGLTGVQLPESLQRLEMEAFGFSGLKEITIPAGVSHMGAYQFMGCEQLKTVRFCCTAPAMNPEFFTSVTANVYYPANDPSWDAVKNRNYGGMLTWIADGRVSSVVLPQGITRIEAETFLNNRSIAEVTIPESVVSIGSKAFKGCESLSILVLGSSVREIAGDAFDGCPSSLMFCCPLGSYAESYAKSHGFQFVPN